MYRAYFQIISHSSRSIKVCTNINKCYCDFGYGGPDCSIQIPMTAPPPTDHAPTPDNTIKMEKKETPYGK